MTTISELVDEFAANTNYTEHDHSVAKEWMELVGCGRFDIRVLTDPKEKLNESDLNRRERIKEGTVEYMRRYFDERPDIVRSLDALFFELGMTDEQERRKEFFQLGRVYNHDELAVLLLKHLQPSPGRGRYTREDIAEYFHTSDRSINDHIRKLQPMADRRSGARVLGQVVQMDPARGTNEPASSTHPLFLPLNMVELYTLVDLLAGHLNDEVEGRIVARILESVLGQTTEYARERLARIEALDTALVSSERKREGKDPAEAVMFSEKERIRVTVVYMDNGEEITCEGFISRNRKNRAIIDIYDGEKVCRIPYRDIVELKSKRE